MLLFASRLVLVSATFCERKTFHGARENVACFGLGLVSMSLHQGKSVRGSNLETHILRRKGLWQAGGGWGGELAWVGVKASKATPLNNHPPPGPFIIP
jgi:hypothetical protein